MKGEAGPLFASISGDRNMSNNCAAQLSSQQREFWDGGLLLYS